MKLNSSVTLKAGLIGAVAAFVLAVITSIPVLGCLVNWVVPVLALVVGASYVHLAVAAGEQVDLTEGAVGGAVTGGIAAVISAFAMGILGLLFGTEFVLGMLYEILLGAVVGAVLGAIGGAIYALVRGKTG
jgi:hypothetical protein